MTARPDENAPKPKRRRSRAVRYVRRAAATLLVLTGLVALALWLVARNLDRRFVKDRLQKLVREHAGLELDYADARAEIFSGLKLYGVTIASPPRFAALAPHVARIGQADLGWSFFGAGPTVQKIVAREVEIVIVVDDDGHTSVDGPPPTGPPAPAPPPVAPSRRLASLLAALPEFGRVGIEGCVVEVLRTYDQHVYERVRLSGVGAEITSDGDEEDPRRTVALKLGTRARPLALEVTRTGDPPLKSSAGHGKLWLDGALAGEKAELHGELTFADQTISSALPKHGTLLGVDLVVRATGGKLHVELGRLDAADNALTTQATLALDDAGAARIEHASGELELGRLLALAPRGHVPVELHGGHLRYAIEGVTIAAIPRIDPKGRLEVDAAVTELSGHRHGKSLALAHARLTLRGRPAPKGGVKLDLDLPAGALTLDDGAGGRVAIAGSKTELDATLAESGAGHAELKLAWDGVEAHGRDRDATAGAGSLALHATELALDLAAPLDSSALLAIDGAVATAELRRRDLSAHLTDGKLGLRTRAQKGAIGSIELELPLGGVQLARAGTTLLPAQPAHLKVRVDHLRLDEKSLERTAAELTIDSTLGPVTVAGTVKKHADDAAIALQLDARTLVPLGPFLAPSLAVPVARMAAHGKLDGTIEALASAAPRLRGHTELHLDKPAITLRGETLSAATLEVVADAVGGARKPEATLTLEPVALQLDDERLGDGQLTSHLVYDAQTPAIDLTVDGKGEALPSGGLTAHAAWDRARRAIVYRVQGELGHLAALEPLLPESLTDEHWLDLSDVRARLASHGTIAGALAPDRRGKLKLVEHPLAGLRGEDDLDLSLEEVRYVDDAGVEANLPTVTLSIHAEAAGERREAHARLIVPRALLTIRGHQHTLTDLDETIDASEPAPRVLELHQRLHLGALDKDWLRAYPIGDLQVEARGRRAADGTIQLAELRIANGAGKSTLTASGDLVLQPRSAATRVQPVVGWRNLALTIALDQALDGVRGDPKRFTGSGTLGLHAEITSGDLQRFHCVGGARFHDASLALPGARIQLDRLDGDVPIVEDLRVRRGVVTLEREPENNAYLTLRFADQHSLSRGGALRAENVTVGDFALGRLAGNLRVAHNLIAIDQLEAQLHGGRVSGQLAIDWRGPDSTLELRLRATGLQPSHGGPDARFDGNAALRVSMKERSIDGRAEILRISRRHLYDLLEEYDPHHTDVGTNRLRTALELGYPDRVRLVFDRGFASLQVAFGGLARVVRVDEVRGIPTGPLVERYLGPFLSPSTEKSDE